MEYVMVIGEKQYTKNYIDHFIKQQPNYELNGKHGEIEFEISPRTFMLKDNKKSRRYNPGSKSYLVPVIVVQKTRLSTGDKLGEEFVIGVVDAVSGFNMLFIIDEDLQEYTYYENKELAQKILTKINGGNGDDEKIRNA